MHVVLITLIGPWGPIAARTEPRVAVVTHKGYRRRCNDTGQENIERVLVAIVIGK